MRIPRIFVPGALASEALVALPAEAAGHAVRVLRLRAGDRLIVFNGEGGEFEAVFERADRKAACVRIGRFHARCRESGLRIHLAQGISRGERMDYTLQKAVELGVAGIVPLHTERSVVQLAGERAERRMLHWQGVVRGACEQCGRDRVPEVANPARLDDWLKARPPAHLALLLDPGADSSLTGLPAPHRDVLLLIGPEGGLSEAERRAACGAGFLPVRLGPRILRTETAALAALAAMQTLWGDLGR